MTEQEKVEDVLAYAQELMEVYGKSVAETREILKDEAHLDDVEIDAVIKEAKKSIKEDYDTSNKRNRLGCVLNLIACAFSSMVAYNASSPEFMYCAIAIAVLLLVFAVICMK